MRINQYVTCIKDMNLLYVQHKVITDTGYVPYALSPSLIEAKVLFVFFFFFFAKVTRPKKAELHYEYKI